MRHYYKKYIFLLFILIFSEYLIAQHKKNIDISGTWSYEVRNTPSGDYTGSIDLRKVNYKYEGEIVESNGMKYPLTVIEYKGDKLVFTSTVENTNSTFTCTFFGDSIKADIDVQGDDFQYKLKGKKVTPDKKKNAL